MNVGTKSQNFDNHSELPMPWVRTQLVFLISVMLAGVGLGFGSRPAGVYLIGAAVILGSIAGIAALIIVRGYGTKL